MSLTTCPSCGNLTTWSWEDAFDKFGYGDGDGVVMTEHVAEALRNRKYEVTVEAWGCHNIVITSIKRAGKELIPATCQLGYDDPRDYLPKAIIKLLDKTFTPDTEVKQ